jgi:hypothetical protein
MIVLYLTLPKDPALLPLLASCASVVPKAMMDAIGQMNLGLDGLESWRHGTPLPVSDARARLILRAEEGRGSVDNSDFRIDSDTEDDTDLPNEFSSHIVPGTNDCVNNADAARRHHTPGVPPAL